MMRLVLFYILCSIIAQLSSSKVNKNLKRDSSTNGRDIKDEVEVAKEVLEVPLMEYEDDSKPSKKQDRIIIAPFVSCICL